MSAAPPPLEILLVEDHAGDAMLIEEIFKRGPCPVHVSHVASGKECLKFLEKAEPYLEAPMPRLLLVDILMPGMDGPELLDILSADERFRRIPVVVLTSRTEKTVVREMYARRCSTYIVKPWTIDELQYISDMIGLYWFGIATLPETER